MRWPFGPPHLTLKPSKKKQKETKQKQKKTKKQEKKTSQKKNSKNTPKLAFQLSVKIFHFLLAFQNFPFLTPWPRKRAPKNTIKIGVFRPFFWKAVVRHETAIFEPKKPKFINFSYHFFGLFSSLSKTKNPKNC